MPSTLQDVVFVSVSDGVGVGVGVMIRGELLRGRNNVAGEFGHVPLSLDGPLCSCGSTGCWEAYISNRATLARYFGQPLTHDASASSERPHVTIDDLIARARGRDAKAVDAIESTARYLGLGLAAVVSTFDPACVYIVSLRRTALSHRASQSIIGKEHREAASRPLNALVRPDLPVCDQSAAAAR